MSEPVELRSLAERVEALTEPDRAVAKDIYRALFPTPELSPEIHGYGWREDASGWWCQTGEDQRVPRQRIDPPNWLGSIDAAMSLVPEGWTWHVDATAPELGIDWFLCEPHTGRDIKGCAGTAALALTAASLRALAQPTVPQP